MKVNHSTKQRYSTKRVRTLYLYSCAIILLLTGIIKLLSIAQTRSFLDLEDPVFSFLTERQLLSAVAVMEISIAGAVFAKRADDISSALVAFQGLSFLGYRIALNIMDYHRPCQCLGGLLDQFGLTVKQLTLISDTLFLYLLIGSVFLFLSDLQRRVFLGNMRRIHPETQM